MSASSHCVKAPLTWWAAVDPPHPSSAQAWGTQVIAWELEPPVKGWSIRRQYGVWKISGGVEVCRALRGEEILCELSVIELYTLLSWLVFILPAWLQWSALWDSQALKNTCCLSVLELFMQAIELMTLRIWIHNICLFIGCQVCLSFVTWRNRWTANVF